jgi:uncharacterized Zn finger protein (UPF0148 family)
MSNFCDECGSAYSKPGAKFCANCGASATTVSLEKQDDKTLKIGTSFEVRCAILSEVWIELRDSENLDVFMREGAISLALAYAIDSDIVLASDRAKELINAQFQELLETIGLDEDEGWEDLDDLRGEDFIGVLDEPEEEE